MVRKGIGIHQKRLARDSESQILSVLIDGEWHRYQELLKKTRLSTATLSKHLKRLEKGLVEKRIDLQSGEYPYPAYYRLKDNFLIKQHLEWRNFLYEQIEKNIEFYLKQPEASIEFINQIIGLQLLNNLHYYFTYEKNEDLLEQNNELLAYNLYQESISLLKNKLEELKQTENLAVILAEAKERMAQDFKIMWKIKFQKTKHIAEAIKKILG